ncbi:uncharacterized protein LOC131255735 isoform X2 [Magnolia sinica]|uniref:uncharacterized protein LOC131255735 isoform X2 n=1 Tax=Magnolia sinica TaxID=86752 RepID=UPI00265A78E8|nr:uncharacterized protein LOC131255735 isoform X2 [Magnolia sinica]
MCIGHSSRVLRMLHHEDLLACKSATSSNDRANSMKGFTRADLVERLTILKTCIQARLLKDGLCSVQDESAGLVVSVVDPQSGETIVDCCAAPGGKTLFMASCLRGKGMVYAIDVNKGRLRILEETAKSHNVNDVITVVHADLHIFSVSYLPTEN